MINIDGKQIKLQIWDTVREQTSILISALAAGGASSSSVACRANMFRHTMSHASVLNAAVLIMGWVCLQRR
jgi:hypothetical protein